MGEYNYEEAFSRNIGWITELEQQQLRAKRVAIAGLGGVGGIYLLTLSRLGIGNFNIADFDKFEIQNFNRQAGAMVSTLGMAKADVVKKMALDINPELQINLFAEGITSTNIDEFLKDVDIYIDGLDFFELKLRRKVFQRCAELGIPAITAAPLNMGTGYLIFMPGKMSFDEYFEFNELNAEDHQINFLIGINPHISAKYLVEPSTTDFEKKRGPSTPMACQLCVGVAGVSALKILLNRGKIYAAPYYHLFDPYSNRFVIKKLRRGNRNILQKIKRFIIKTKLRKIKASHMPSAEIKMSMLEKILNLARWAPSVENTQPWRFKVLAEDKLKITLNIDPIMQDGNFGSIPTLMTLGTLIESITITASKFKLRCTWSYSDAEKLPTVLINFVKDENLQTDNLVHFLKLRSVDRLAYKRDSLTTRQKTVLADAVGTEFQINWFVTKKEKKQFAQLNSKAMRLQLSLPQLFALEHDTLDWENKFSDDKMPAQTLGIGSMRRKLMGWVTHTWKRTVFFNRFFGGAYSAALELSYFPSLSCGAHFLMTSKKSFDDALLCIRAGQAMQRMWLTATKLGLVMQPNFAPLCFNYLVSKSLPISEKPKFQKLAKDIANTLQQNADNQFIFINARIGYPRKPQNSTTSRSHRLPLSALMEK